MVSTAGASRSVTSFCMYSDGASVTFALIQSPADFMPMIGAPASAILFATKVSMSLESLTRASANAPTRRSPVSHSGETGPSALIISRSSAAASHTLKQSLYKKHIPLRDLDLGYKPICTWKKLASPPTSVAARVHTMPHSAPPIGVLLALATVSEAKSSSCRPKPADFPTYAPGAVPAGGASKASFASASESCLPTAPIARSHSKTHPDLHHTHTLCAGEGISSASARDGFGVHAVRDGTPMRLSGSTPLDHPVA
mmetsp:Transcript_18914/g.46432  ORF Transcript_18914/g.46432 Transcript_18914/m.46432 type:complete len:256 (+) Transcript_18914:521-1288(+)